MKFLTKNIITINFIMGFILFIFSGLNGYKSVWIYMMLYFSFTQILCFFANRKMLLGYELVGINDTKKNYYIRVNGLLMYLIIFVASFLKVIEFI